MSYCEIPEFFSDSYPVAKKEHACCECLEPINVGEKHGKFSGKWGGEFSTYRQHNLCQRACEFIRDHFQSGECIGFGGLRYSYKECTERNEWRALSENEIKFRSIMAGVLWRQRKQYRELKRERRVTKMIPLDEAMNKTYYDSLPVAEPAVKDGALASSVPVQGSQKETDEHETNPGAAT